MLTITFQVVVNLYQKLPKQSNQVILQRDSCHAAFLKSQWPAQQVLITFRMSDLAVLTIFSFQDFSLVSIDRKSKPGLALTPMLT